MVREGLCDACGFRKRGLERIVTGRGQHELLCPKCLSWHEETHDTDADITAWSLKEARKWVFLSLKSQSEDNGRWRYNAWKSLARLKTCSPLPLP